MSCCKLVILDANVGGEKVASVFLNYSNYREITYKKKHEGKIKRIYTAYKCAPDYAVFP